MRARGPGLTPFQFRLIPLRPRAERATPQHFGSASTRIKTLVDEFLPTQNTGPGSDYHAPIPSLIIRGVNKSMTLYR